MKKLNYDFKNPDLLALALTQSGADAVNNNERLEFIGDRVLNLTVAVMLYDMFPTEAEGELARRHAMLVSTETLADIAIDLGLDKKLRRGHMTAGRLRHILANATEAIFGAIYIDGGFDAARAFVFELLEPVAKMAAVAPKDAKTALQEFVQHADDGALPEYEYAQSIGASHNPVFAVTVRAMGKSATGNGASKKSASVKAAEELLAMLAVASDQFGENH